MTPAMVSGIAQALPQLSTATSNPSLQEEKGAASPAAAVSPVKENVPAPVDTVSISEQSRLAMAGVKDEKKLAEEAQKQKAKKEEADKISNSGKSGGAVAKVQFVYDMKGVLSMRYMDTANRLIFQVPSELMLRIKEAVSKSDASVDTRA